jgi:pimeloyl-ACP methyl ester carboxylesterase
VLERRPEGGLAYRLTMSARATPRRPNRLIVWLHPSGASYNSPVEGLAPVFLRHGFALMVMTDKNTQGWTHDDARRLLGATLPDVGTLPGIQVRKPVLMGFSAGGQVALELYSTKPDLYGGVILDAAYPAESIDGKDVLLAPPDHPAIGQVPLFVLVGGEDPLLWVWEKVKGPWLEAGVPLSVHVVPGKGHAWLFGEEQVAALGLWLDGIAPLPGAEDQAVAPPQEEPKPAVQP